MVHEMSPVKSLIPKPPPTESQLSEDGHGDEDIIGEFAKQYEEHKISEVQNEYRARDPIEEEEEEQDYEESEH